MTNTINNLFAQIAKRHLFLQTLETRNSDSLDFHEVAVWSVRDALEAAFKAGVEVGMATTEPTQSGLRNS